ncbi:MAG: RNA polymerase sigma factor [Elusimicrobia bacterium]|nr:RNA polymerase sigma factor [Elusimicrobiota bacterium]
MILDARLVGRVLEGDHDAFGLLVRQYQGPIHALIRHFTRNAAAADEIAQDAFVAAYQKLGQLEDASRFGGWLRAIALNRCRMWRRGQQRGAKTVPLSEEDGAGLEAARREAAGRDPERPLGIGAMIGRLPAKLQTAAMLCLDEELSPSAAASVLGLKPGTLRKRLHAARARLQRQIVETAQRELRMHLLPGDFAERCICRCEKSRREKPMREVRLMNKKVGCGCGCVGAAKARPRKKPGARTKARK